MTCFGVLLNFEARLRSVSATSCYPCDSPLQLHSVALTKGYEQCKAYLPNTVTEAVIRQTWSHNIERWLSISACTHSQLDVRPRCLNTNFNSIIHFPHLGLQKNISPFILHPVTQTPKKTPTNSPFKLPNILVTSIKLPGHPCTNNNGIALSLSTPSLT